MTRLASIVRYREKAMDKAALVSALSHARLDEPSALAEFASRQDAQLIDLLHDWAFVSRKLIEATGREQMRCHAYAKRTTVFCGAENEHDDSGIVWFSLIDLFGRMIHSDHLSIDRARVPTQDGSHARGESAWAFRVASDRDKPGHVNFVYLEFLLSEFLTFDEQLRHDLRLAEIREANT